MGSIMLKVLGNKNRCLKLKRLLGAKVMTLPGSKLGAMMERLGLPIMSEIRITILMIKVVKGK